MPRHEPERLVQDEAGRVMAKPPSAIGKKKREAAMTRRLERGQKKLAAKQARAANKATNHQEKNT